MELLSLIHQHTPKCDSTLLQKHIDGEFREFDLTNERALRYGQRGILWSAKATQERGQGLTSI